MIFLEDIYRNKLDLYYLPMESMKHTGDYELDEINMLEQECQDLEEENKRLEEENKTLYKKLQEIGENNFELEQENKQLRENYRNLANKVAIKNWYKASYVNELRDKVDELERENIRLRDIIVKINYLYNEEPSELGEYIKSWFKWWMSN